MPLHEAKFFKRQLAERNILLFIIQEIIYIPDPIVVVHEMNEILFRYVKEVALVPGCPLFPIPRAEWVLLMFKIIV